MRRLLAATAFAAAACGDGGAQEPLAPCQPNAHRWEGVCICDADYQQSGEACVLQCPEHRQRSDGSCAPPVPLSACCECLDRTLRTGSTEPCLPVSTATCEAQSVIVSTTCPCWEDCYDYCADTMYPYEEPPNGCQY